MERLRILIPVFFLAAIASVSQTQSTAILGTVLDPSGAVVAGAKVSVLNLQTGIKREDTHRLATFRRKNA